MCLAVPGKIVECSEDEALVDLQGNRLKISTVLTPEAAAGDWVLVHAGFAIAEIEEQDALETWDYLQAAFGDAVPEAGGDPGEPT
jgi:hydrogenase expression/formation protein HypC